MSTIIFAITALKPVRFTNGLTGKSIRNLPSSASPYLFMLLHYPV